MPPRPSRVSPRVLALAVLAAALAVGTAGWFTARGRPRRIPEPIWGVTIDSVEPLNDIEAALDGFRTKLTARVVFDSGPKPLDYRPALERIARHAWIMGELVDSYDMKTYTLAAHHARVVEYWRDLHDLVNVWEIGNEVNGEWLGKYEDVAAKIIDANAYVKAQGGRTAVTPFFNPDCWSKPDQEMFAWIERYLPPAFRNHVDYVLISWYEEECEWQKPDFTPVFRRLGTLFPNSRVGFGEVGVKKASLKADTLRRYYGMKVQAPRYVGGYFWWFFNQDMLPKSKPMWQVLHDAIP
jgi:hypothetical protein